MNVRTILPPLARRSLFAVALALVPGSLIALPLLWWLNRRGRAPARACDAAICRSS